MLKAPEKTKLYLELEMKFRSQVEQDKTIFKDQIEEAYFVPNPYFSSDPKYCLIALEPSFGLQRELIKVEFLNSFKNFLIHYCAYNYLCKGSFDYHITDISKSAMKAKEAGAPGIRSLVYKNWLPLLKEELQVLSGGNKDRPKVITIGKTVQNHLENYEPPIKVAKNVLHYSENNNSRFMKYVAGLGSTNSLDYDILFDNVREFGIALMKFLNFSIEDLEYKLKPENGIFNKDGFSDNRKNQHLNRFYYYKTEFEKISNQ